LALTAVDAMIGPPITAKEYLAGQEGREKCEVCGICELPRQKQWFHFSVAKVKDFAAHRDRSAVEPDGSEPPSAFLSK
jgi:hypothetical protein